MHTKRHAYATKQISVNQKSIEQRHKICFLNKKILETATVTTNQQFPHSIIVPGCKTQYIITALVQITNSTNYYSVPDALLGQELCMYKSSLHQETTTTTNTTTTTTTFV